MQVNEPYETDHLPHLAYIIIRHRSIESNSGRPVGPKSAPWQPRDTMGLANSSSGQLCTALFGMRCEGEMLIPPSNRPHVSCPSARWKGGLRFKLEREGERSPSGCRSFRSPPCFGKSNSFGGLYRCMYTTFSMDANEC
jgi:hypothetical protein